jgi:hypothetical protein
MLLCARKGAKRTAIPPSKEAIPSHFYVKEAVRVQSRSQVLAKERCSRSKEAIPSHLMCERSCQSAKQEPHPRQRAMLKVKGSYSKPSHMRKRLPNCKASERKQAANPTPEVKGICSMPYCMAQKRLSKCKASASSLQRSREEVAKPDVRDERKLFQAVFMHAQISEKRLQS